MVQWRCELPVNETSIVFGRRQLHIIAAINCAILFAKDIILFGTVNCNRHRNPLLACI